MEGLSVGELTIELAEGAPPAPIQALWRGKSTDRYPGKVLGPYFGAVLKVARERNVALELNFKRLDLFNSATIAAIIQLLQDARGQGVRLVIVYDQALKWQKLSFDALRVFVKADGLLELRSS